MEQTSVKKHGDIPSCGIWNKKGEKEPRMTPIARIREGAGYDSPKATIEFTELQAFGIRDSLSAIA